MLFSNLYSGSESVHPLFLERNLLRTRRVRRKRHAYKLKSHVYGRETLLPATGDMGVEGKREAGRTAHAADADPQHRFLGGPAVVSDNPIAPQFLYLTTPRHPMEPQRHLCPQTCGLRPSPSGKRGALPSKPSQCRTSTTSSNP